MTAHETHVSILKDLQPIAARMRERQEVIDAGKRGVMDGIGNLVVLASEQGRDILLAKTKLGGTIRWGDWLESHVPNLTKDEASKYERITCEQLKSPRACAFAFLPIEGKNAAAAATGRMDRVTRNPWEQIWFYGFKLAKVLRQLEVKGMPAPTRTALREELEPLVRHLWPERFKS